MEETNNTKPAVQFMATDRCLQPCVVCGKTHGPGTLFAHYGCWDELTNEQQRKVERMYYEAIYASGGTTTEVDLQSHGFPIYGENNHEEEG